MTEKATFAGGCFWCTEAIFRRIKGVITVSSGYSGGNIENPTYDDLHYSNTNHAEAVQLEFDPSVISFDDLLEIFFVMHDPTTLNRQGADRGVEYRSAIFYHDLKQKQKAMEAVEKVNKIKIYKDPIVTEISPFKAFYKAEEYHQNFYEENKNPIYCNIVISPKIEKLIKKFNDKVKDEYK